MSAEVGSRQVKQFKYELQKIIAWEPTREPHPDSSLYLLTDSNRSDNL